MGLGFLDWLTIAAFTMSLVTWVLAFKNQRRKLSIDLVAADPLHGVYYFSFENRSRLPVAITRIAIITADGLADSKAIPEIVFISTRRNGNSVTDQAIQKSFLLPVNLDPLGATAGYVCFREDRHILEADAKSVTFLIGTNRGKAIQKIFSLPRQSIANLNNM